MTALDQAFIKAYVQQGDVPAPASVERARPVPLAEVLSERRSSAPSLPPEVRRLAAVEALETGGHSGRTHSPPSPPPRGRTCCRAPAGRTGETGLSLEDLQIPPVVCRFGPPAPDAPVPPDESPAAAGAETLAPPQAEPTGPDAASVPGTFLPQLQTDRFDWPQVCRVLDAEAAGQLDRLADALVSGAGRGQKVVGLGGLRRGDGCTTLLLCAARRLARRGLKVAMVDADAEGAADESGIGGRLGLEPEAGWQDVAAGRTPLAQAVIESLGDRLDVLPSCVSHAGEDNRTVAQVVGHVSNVPLDHGQVGNQPHTLRDSYDLVLVDLGPLLAAEGDEGPAAQAAAGAVDAVVLVCDARSTPGESLAAVRERLAAAGIAEAGLVENFVPSSEQQAGTLTRQDRIQHENTEP